MENSRSLKWHTMKCRCYLFFSLESNSIQGHKFKVKNDTGLTFNKSAAMQIIKKMNSINNTRIILLELNNLPFSSYEQH